MSQRLTVVLAAAVVLVAWVAPPVPWPVAVGAVVVALCWRRPPCIALALLLVVAGRADQQLGALAAPLPARVDGIAELVDDPQEQQFGVGVLVRIDGRRYAAGVPWELAAPLREAGRGDRFVLSGRTRPLRGAPLGWVRSRHLAGRLSVTELERGPPAAPWFAGANAVRRVYRAGSTSFGDELRPLYLGMVIGDDRELSDLRRFRFRAAGLSHLTAVSGQNVAFLLAVAAPVVTRLGPRGRVLVTVVLLVVLVLVTRADPSVLRASVMAGLCAVALSAGRTATAVRVLALTITILVVVDPMLVHALGFRLSVAATAGLVLLSGPIERLLPEPTWLGPAVRRAVAVTLAAQLATLPLVLALGPVSVVSIPANVLAVPAAGAVMMMGVVSGLLAGLAAEPIAAVLQLPVRALVAWVDTVARVATSLPVSPLEPWRAAALVAVGAVVLVARRQARRPAGAPLPVRLVGVAGVVAAVALCWPGAPPPGAHDLGPGTRVVVGSCGGVVVALSVDADTVDTLEALHRHDVHRIDVLVVGPGRAERRVATAVAAQWPVRRRAQLPAATGRFVVGGVQVDVGGAAATIEASEAACRLTP